MNYAEWLRDKAWKPAREYAVGGYSGRPDYTCIWLRRYDADWLRGFQEAGEPLFWEPRRFRRKLPEGAAKAKFFQESSGIKRELLRSQMRLAERGGRSDRQKADMAKADLWPLYWERRLRGDPYPSNGYEHIRALLCMENALRLEKEEMGYACDLFRTGLLRQDLIADCIRREDSWEQMAINLRQMLVTIQGEIDAKRMGWRDIFLEFCEDDYRWLLLTGRKPEMFCSRFSPYGFSPDSWVHTLALMGPPDRDGDGITRERNAFSMAVAYGPGNLEKLKRRSGKNLYDLSNFDLPARGKWSIGAWRNLLMHHAGNGSEMLHMAPQIEASLGRAPRTLDEAVKASGKLAYPGEIAHPEVIRLARTCGLTHSQFKRYTHLLKGAKSQDRCPDIRVGISHGKMAMTFRRLAPGDPKGPMLGYLTNCCQHLGEAAEGCAIEGTTSPTATFYVLEREDKVLAQCFAWRDDRSLVFDSWEPLAPELGEACQLALSTAARAAMEADPSLQRVLLGTGGRTPKLALPITSKPARYSRKNIGGDARRQYILLKKTNGYDPTKPKSYR